jgi:peptide chain release factor 1
METSSINTIILEIRAGAGGDEASIFAGDLARMYKKFAERQGWKTKELDASPGVRAGYKSYSARISGSGVYETLKNESGVHRVQRVPETEAKGRVHTSTASVAVLPEVEAKEVEINPSDLEVSFFRSSGPGGQNVNKVETAVRIRHIPTGVVVSSQAGRSQHSNREQAMTMLRAKLYEHEKTTTNSEVSGMRNNQIGNADRSEKIRTYNFPQDRITDHRIKKKWGNIEKILDGNFDVIARAFKKRKVE